MIYDNISKLNGENVLTYDTHKQFYTETQSNVVFQVINELISLLTLCNPARRNANVISNIGCICHINNYV